MWDIFFYFIPHCSLLPIYLVWKSSASFKLTNENILGPHCTIDNIKLDLGQILCVATLMSFGYETEHISITFSGLLIRFVKDLFIKWSLPSSVQNYYNIRSYGSRLSWSIVNFSFKENKLKTKSMTRSISTKFNPSLSHHALAEYLTAKYLNFFGDLSEENVDKIPKIF